MNKNKKRIDWDEYFLGMVEVASLRSEDPNTKVGAVIVNSTNRVIGIGYNGMPSGLDFSWSREAEFTKDTKYPYVIHAEINSVLNSTIPVNGSRIYVSLFPCSNCAKLLTQAGIKEVIYMNDKYKETEDNAISKNIFNVAKIKYRHKNLTSIIIK